jgi:NTE family protein
MEVIMGNKKIGIALGGGGSRGFAHIGVLKALKEKGIEPDVISGTSAGAIVGCLVADGKTPEEIMTIMGEIELTDVAKIELPKKGFASLDNLRKKLNKNLKASKFSELEKPLYLGLSNLLTGEIDYISTGNITKAVQGSASIPIIFSPVEINGQVYVDGGLLDNVPVKPLINQCDIIIAVDIMPIEKIDAIEDVKDVITRVFQMSTSMQNYSRDSCDLIIELEAVADYNILDTRHNEEIYNLGYDYVKNLDLSQFN